MRAARATAAATLGVLALGAASGALAQVGGPADWPQFQGGPEHRGVAASAPAPPYRVRWTFVPPDGGGLSGAVLAGDVAIAVGRRAVVAVDAATGELAWELPRADAAPSMPAIATGNRELLLYVDGPAAEQDGATPSPGTPTPGVSPSPTDSPTSESPSPTPGADPEERTDAFLVAIDLEDRSERWRTPLGGASRSGVTVSSDTALVGDQDGRVHAVAIRDGAVRWTADLAEGTGGEEGCGAFEGADVDVPIAVVDSAALVVGRDTAGGQTAVSALDAATGACRWRVFAQVGSPAISAAAGGDGIAVVGTADRFVRGLGLDEGAEAWSALALSVFSPLGAPALDAEGVYAADLGGGLYRLDGADGSRTWSHQLNEVVLGPPVLAGDVVLLGLEDGRLVAVDAASGHLVWEGATGEGRLVALAVGPEVIVAEKGGPDAGLVAFEADPGGTLLDVPPPTELDLPVTAARLGIAAAAVLVVVAVPGLWLRRRRSGALGLRDEPAATEDDELEDDARDGGAEDDDGDRTGDDGGGRDG